MATNAMHWVIHSLPNLKALHVSGECCLDKGSQGLPPDRPKTLPLENITIGRLNDNLEWLLRQPKALKYLSVERIYSVTMYCGRADEWNVGTVLKAVKPQRSSLEYFRLPSIKDGQHLKGPLIPNMLEFPVLESLELDGLRWFRCAYHPAFAILGPKMRKLIVHVGYCEWKDLKYHTAAAFMTQGAQQALHSREMMPENIGAVLQRMHEEIAGAETFEEMEKILCGSFREVLAETGVEFCLQY